MRKAVLVLMVLSLLLVVGAQPAAASGKKIIHVVKWGENLFRISLRYGTTVHAIAAANHIRNPNRIYAGQRLVIPTGKHHKKGGGCYQCGGGFWYRVHWGDTLSAIGWRYGVSPWAIAAANHLRNPNCIYAGQRLWIPG